VHPELGHTAFADFDGEASALCHEGAAVGLDAEGRAFRLWQQARNDAAGMQAQPATLELGPFDHELSLAPGADSDTGFEQQTCAAAPELDAVAACELLPRACRTLVHADVPRYERKPDLCMLCARGVTAELPHANTEDGDGKKRCRHERRPLPEARLGANEGRACANWGVLLAALRFCEQHLGIHERAWQHRPNPSLGRASGAALAVLAQKLLVGALELLPDRKAIGQ
jgi:hypothetical protein